MGKLIIIEGTDGSGKSTQFSLLAKRLEEESVPFKHIVFPRYKEESSALIRMYLGGQFGTNPTDVNAYAATTFFAVDRFASYKTEWEAWYKDGGVVLSDRYTTSNAVHQASKLDGKERDDYLSWLYDFEYQKIGLPKPDLVLYLDVPTDFTQRLLRHREQDTNTKADIHEQDSQYLSKCRQAGREAAEFSGWTVISCVRDGHMRSIDDIHQEIFSHVKNCLEG